MNLGFNRRQGTLETSDSLCCCPSETLKAEMLRTPLVVWNGKRGGLEGGEGGEGVRNKKNIMVLASVPGLTCRQQHHDQPCSHLFFPSLIPSRSSPVINENAPHVNCIPQRQRETHTHNSRLRVDRNGDPLETAHIENRQEQFSVS